MARRFRWTPANILILVVIAALVVLGAGYLVRISQLTGAQLRAAAAPEKKLQNDSRCKAGSSEDTLGTLVVKVNPFKATSAKNARETSLKNIRKYVKTWDCYTDFSSFLKGIKGGQATFKQNITKEMAGAIKEGVKCSDQLDTNGEPKCKSPAMCTKAGTQCFNITAEKDSSTGAESTTADCKITHDPEGPTGKGFYSAIEITCTIRVKTSAICSCAPPAKTSSTPLPSSTPTYYTSIPVMTPILGPTPTVTTIMTPILETKTPTPTTKPPLTI